MARVSADVLNPDHLADAVHPLDRMRQHIPDDLGFVFGYKPGPHMDTGPLQAYWTNFAKTGDPNGEGLPEWPVYDLEARRYLEFTNDGPVAREKLREPVCDWLASP